MNPKFIDHLASDASSIAVLKRLSREFVDGGRKLLCESHSFASMQDSMPHIREVEEAIANFSDEIGEKLATLDQTIRDILQFVIIRFPLPRMCFFALFTLLTMCQEFAWVSVNEAHRSTRMAESMQRLSWITAWKHRAFKYERTILISS